MAAMLLLVMSCTQVQAPAGAPLATAGGPTGTVVVGMPTFSKEVLDPTFDSGDGKIYSGNTTDWLIGISADGKVDKTSGVLEDWQASPDAKTYTLRVRRGIKWHDGSDLTADDVKFSLDYMTQTGTVCLSCGPLAKNLASADVLDQYTVRVSLKVADNAFIELLSPVEGDAKVVPMRFIQQKGKDEYGKNPMGSGPWKFVARKQGEYAEFEVNRDYWNKDQMPRFEKMKLVLTTDPTTRLAMLRTGELDIASIGLTEIAAAEKAGLKISAVKRVATPFLGFPQSYDPAMLTNKLDFRKALSLAIDRKALVARFYPSTVADSAGGQSWPFNQDTRGYDAGLRPYESDPAQAKELLKKVGYQGQPLQFWSFALTNNPEQPEVNEVIAQMWRDVGINVELTPVDFGSYFPKTTGAKQEFTKIPVATYSSRTRPTVVGNMLTWMLSKAKGGLSPSYWNPSLIDAEYTKLVTSTNPAEVEAQLLALNGKLREEYWALPLIVRHQTYAVGPRIADWRPTAGNQSVPAFNTLVPKR